MSKNKNANVESKLNNLESEKMEIEIKSEIDLIPELSDLEKIKKENELLLISLSAYKDEISKMQLKEIKSSKEHLYIYPSEWNNDKRLINGIEGKNWRSKRRKELEKIENNIFYFVKTENNEELKKSVAQFYFIYKKYYSLNDLSVNSVTRSNDEKIVKSMEFMLKIIKSLS